MKALIIGSIGFVGEHLAKKTSGAVLTKRSIKKIHKIFAGREARQWDGSKNIDPSFFDGIDTVYHLAEESIFKGR